MFSISELSWQQALLIAISIFTAWLIASTYLQYRKLAHVPGPLIAALTPWWLAYHTLRGDVYAACHEQLERSGSPVRIKPDVVVSNDPASFRMFAAAKSPVHRGTWYEGMKFDPKVDNILSMRDEQAHAVRRKQLIPGYTAMDVPSIENDIDGNVLELKKYIHQYANAGQAFDMAQAIHYFALDVLCKISFGESLGYLPKNEDIFKYIEETSAFLPFLELSLNHPTFLSILRSPLLAGFAPKPTDKTGLGALLGHTKKVVEERLATGAQHDDVIGSFIKNGLTATELESEAFILILAGTDSTSTGLRITLLYIMTNPLVYAKLRKEIDAAAAVEPVIRNNDAQSLPYLKAVILEGLRMFMPLTGLAHHVLPKGGSVLEGVFIPDNVEVAFQLYSMLRRKDLFGPDADTFRPERWIDNDPETIQTMERHHSLLFASGRFLCLGKNIALLEIRKVIFELFRSFDFVVVNPLHPMHLRANGAVAIKDMYVRAYAREPSQSG